MNKYQQFHELNRDIAMKMLTIQDGDRLDGSPDNVLATGTNKDLFDECLEMMQQAKKLADEISLQEAEEG